MSSPSLALDSFQTYGWTQDDSLSEDENFMDLVLILTRSSQLRQGGMACLLVRPGLQEAPAAPTTTRRNTAEATIVRHENEGETITTDAAAGDVKSNNTTLLLKSRIVSAATNRSLYRAGDSDIHAEICALGQAARVGCPTVNCTAYITMPPCKRCFAALLVSGVRRIVSRYDPPVALLATAEQQGVEMVSTGNTSQQTARVNAIVKMYDNDADDNRKIKEKGNFFNS